MTYSRIALGQQGEELAAAFITDLGYRIVGRNVRFREGELDLVALDGQTLVFIEVRTRSSTQFGTPLESITRRKQQKLRQLALLFLAEHDGGAYLFRFDVISVQYKGEYTSPEIIHLLYAF
ncbi:YraN family protein [Brevibacillus dissolubilis]|uniref:YraN family protein n=1 Tax=Brevibacillus dissolubilis TaxID=1844116 RepID=UPI001117071E|nr:YraN family protein [Brevibacillus dissolubilis]